MTLDQFVVKYNGKYIDWDGVYGYQCVDLMRFYQRDVLGVVSQSIPAAGTAKQIFNNFPAGGNKHFIKILNSPTNSPQKGDIVFWGTYLFVTGWAGHVGVCSEAGLYSLITFDQNYPTGSSCRFVKHSYKGVMGWLHKR